MTAETDIAAIGTGQPNTALEVRTALTAVLARADGAWTAYVPAWTTSGTQPVLGNGTLTGRSVQYGKTVIGSLVLTAGTTTTFGTNAFQFSLPAAASLPPAGAKSPIGLAIAENVGVQVFTGVVLLLNDGTIYVQATTASTEYANNQPFTWANTDYLRLSFTYEAA